MTTTERANGIRHETRALLRAHLSAAVGYRHLTRHCPVCHRLLRLVQESAAGEAPVPSPRALDAALAAEGAQGPRKTRRDESPAAW